MPSLEVAVVMRETQGAVQLCFWNDLTGRHECRWAPKSLVKTEAHAGQRDIVVEVYAALANLQGWEFLLQNERDEFMASQGE